MTEIRNQVLLLSGLGRVRRTFDEVVHEFECSDAELSADGLDIRVRTARVPVECVEDWRTVADSAKPAMAKVDAELTRLTDRIQAALDLHKPMRIYGECGHTHQPGDPGTLEVDDVGLVCEDGYEYTICLECCADGSAQTEDCATNHPHLDEGPCYPCPTRRALEGEQ